MSAEATSAPDPDVAMLARLAALDLAAAEQAHGRLMAASDVGEINDLGRTYERFARSLRRTLALKARLAQDAAARAERQAMLERHRPPPPDPGGMAPIHRIHDLQDALGRVGHAAGVRGAAALEQLYDRVDAEAHDWTEHEDFADGDLDAQVRWLCGRLGLPAHLAAAWRDLPHPDEAPPPWAEGAEPPAGGDGTSPAAGPAPHMPAARPESARWRDPLPSHWDTG